MSVTEFPSALIEPPTAPPAPEAALPEAPAGKQRPTALMALAATMTALAVVFAGLWITTRSDLSAAQDRIAGFEAADTAREALESAKPNLGQAVSRNNLSRYNQSSGSESASLHFSEYSSGWEDDLQSLLSDLGFNASAVVSRMGRTRALDGTQSAEGRNVNATWTYHPDNGLNIVLEVED